MSSTYLAAAFSRRLIRLVPKCDSYAARTFESLPLSRVFDTRTMNVHEPARCSVPPLGLEGVHVSVGVKMVCF